jgi:hypothetical protein
MTITAHSLKCRILELQDEFDSYSEDTEQQRSLLRKELDKLDSVKEEVKALAFRYAAIDGAHHKQWLIDQMVRVLLAEGYQGFVAEYNKDEDYDDWDEGIAP